MLKVIDSINGELKMSNEFIDALKKRALKREITGDLMRSLEDLSAACMLEDFKNNSTMIAADRISKKLGKKLAREAMQSRTLIAPSKQFINTYLASFCGDPVLNDLKEHTHDHDEELQGYNKALCSFVKQKFADMLPSCTEEIECDGEQKMEALLLRSSLYFSMGDYLNAFRDANAVVESDQPNKTLKVYALIKRASANVHLNEPEKSANDFEKAVELDPTNCDVFYHRGQYHLQVQNLKKAMEDCHEAFSLNPNFPFAYMQKCYTDYRYATFLQCEDKLQEVLKCFEEGLTRFQNCSEYYSLFSQIMCDRGDYEKASFFFDRALEIEPNNATILVHKGILLLEWKEDVEGAKKYISDALKVDPNCEFAYESLGTIDIQCGDLEGAVKHFDKAISLALSESELEHLFSLRNVALAQAKAVDKLDLLLVSEPEDETT